MFRLDAFLPDDFKGACVNGGKGREMSKGAGEGCGGDEKRETRVWQERERE